jgi:putative RNA 2'-phosphotransferase
MNYTELSKVVSHALRHEPWIYELELDDEGWVHVSQLLESLRSENDSWSELSQSDLEDMIRGSGKVRHEIHDNRIRAIYGHSIPGKLKRVPASPPEILFHGTTPKSVSAIRKSGLKPMKRQNVHLSTDEKTAIEVGKRKAKGPVLLRVYADRAFEKGVSFYEGNEKVWLADVVPPEFIEFCGLC